MEYKFEITETLSAIVTVNASSFNDAYREVKRMYRNAEIVLDDSNYVDTEIRLLEEDSVHSERQQ